MRKISMKRRSRQSKHETNEEVEKDDFEEVSNGDIQDKSSPEKKRKKKGKQVENGRDEDSDSNAADKKDDDGVEDASDAEGAAEEPEVKKKKGKKKASKKTEKPPKEVEKDDDEEDEADYEVEAIVDDRRVKNLQQYLIQWKGYGSDQNTWEPASILNCTDILQKYKDVKAKLKAKKEEEDYDVSKEYEVERIKEVHFKRDGKREFLVSWKGYASSDNSWEPEENLNCVDLINKFMAKVDKAKTVDQRSLRPYRAPTERFTLTTSDSGRRISKRRGQKQRIRYVDCE